MIKKDQIKFKLDKYECYVEYSHAPAREPEIDYIWFEPDLNPDEVQFKSEVVIHENDTMSEVLIRHQRTIEICGVPLFEEIESRL